MPGLRRDVLLPLTAALLASCASQRLTTFKHAFTGTPVVKVQYVGGLLAEADTSGSDVQHVFSPREYQVLGAAVVEAVRTVFPQAQASEITGHMVPGPLGYRQIGARVFITVEVGGGYRCTDNPKPQHICWLEATAKARLIDVESDVADEPPPFVARSPAAVLPSLDFAAMRKALPPAEAAAGLRDATLEGMKQYLRKVDASAP